jgi:ribosomal protein S27AE
VTPAFTSALAREIQQAVTRVLARVQICPHCRHPFLKQHRQRYCSPRCQQIAKVRAYRARQKLKVA